MTGSTLWLLGAGNMGGAMLRGWIADGIDPARVTVIDPGGPELPAGVSHVAAFPETGWPDVLVLAVKPQQLRDVIEVIRGRAGAPQLLLSILAGVETGTLVDAFGAEATIRAMPNLPVAIGEGVTALYGADVAPGVRAQAEALVTPLGLVEWIEQEVLFDAVTALSGCGPGFVFRFIDALAAAGTALGLPREQAARLASATVRGSALMAAGSDESPAVLADRVASPGGSTREGLNVLDHDQSLAQLLKATLAASAQRNRELASVAGAG